MIDAPALDSVENEIQAQLTGWVRDFHLLVQGQGLILRGHAGSYYAKQIAQHAVMRATSIPILANDIEVC